MDVNNNNSAMPADAKTLIDVTAQGGEAFVKDAFYKVFDSTRHEIYRLYREGSVVTWDGTAVRGVANIMEFFKALPPSTHTVESIDCHPIPLPGQPPSAAGILVNVVGTVSFAEATPRTFNQTFLLAQDPSGQARHYYIANDCVRFKS